ncbi:MAG TPA: OmpA family protein [Defluviitoga tunisiensis]|nr:OmpA family protein [Defluviitoga tunisiensis]HOL87221.1 OmpA family protein [Defluviitoga tunisiensis]
MRLTTKPINEPNENPYELSIGDLMANLLLIIILILTSVMLRLEKQYEPLSEQEKIKQIIKDKLIEELSEYDVEIDRQTGVIVIREGVLFKFDDYVITPSGEAFLQKFVPEYVGILLSDPIVREQISQIIIEGHTDNKGTYKYNLELSLNRAKSVANFIFSEKIGNFYYKEELQKILSANGRSYVEPRETNETEEGRAKNRRVEFKFRMMDWDMIKKKE